MDKPSVKPVIFRFNSNVNWIYIEIDQSFNIKVFEEAISGISNLQIIKSKKNYDASFGTLESTVQMTTNLGVITIDYHRRLDIDPQVLSPEEREWWFDRDSGYYISANPALMEMVLSQLNSSNYFLDATEPQKEIEPPFVSLKPTFESLLSTYQKSPNKIKIFWKEIMVNYNHPQRFYHTLTHLRNLFSILELKKNEIVDWEVVQFAVFYHDIVFDVSRSDNEEQSAVWAERVMQSLEIDPQRIDRCKRHILATKGHGIDIDPDTNLFTDADLSILGSDSETYEKYSNQIRQEYIQYDDNTYNTGRKKILETFLRSQFIYKTEAFKMKFEEQARENIEREFKTLS